MNPSSTRVLLAAAVLLAVLAVADAHSYLTNPLSRTQQRFTQSGCRGPFCRGPCDRTKASSTTFTTIARGTTLSLEWPRNNHAGGFIRVAWAAFDQSDSHEAFDAGVQKYTCHEIGGCFPDSASDPNGGDSGPGDGSSRACKTTVTVPLNLADGRYTLQWAWYGGAFALGDYYSCVDYQVSGGPTGAKPSPVFVGGDFSNPGANRCKFFNTNRIRRCVDEPCANPGPIFAAGAAQNGVPGDFTGVPNDPVQTTTSAPTQTTTGAPTQTTTRAPTQTTTSAPISGGSCTRDFDCVYGTCSGGACTCSTRWCLGTTGKCDRAAEYNWNNGQWQCSGASATPAPVQTTTRAPTQTTTRAPTQTTTSAPSSGAVCTRDFDCVYGTCSGGACTCSTRWCLGPGRKCDRAADYNWNNGQWQC